MKKRFQQFARLGAAGLVVVLVAAACGSDSDSGDSSSNGGSSDSSGVEAAKATVAEYTAEPEWAPEGEPISGTEALEGGTIWHVMIDASIPAFQPVIEALETAVGEVGMSLQGCDAQFTPDGATNCVDQAIQAGATAIITNGVPTAYVEATYERTDAAGIPFVMGAEPRPEGLTTPDSVVFVNIDHVLELALVADWIIADSEGSAESLLIALTEGGGGRATVDDGFYATMDERCPGCTNHEIETAYTNLDALPSSLGAALNQYPNVEYVIPQFDGIVTPALPGIQASGRAGDFIGVTGNAAIVGLQMIANEDFLRAASGSSNYINAWIEVDQAIRLALGLDPVEDPRAPTRLFTSENIGELELTPAAEASGQWFGIDDVAALYRAHWGLDG